LGVMTTIDELRAQVGAEKFAQAQRWAWETAADTGKTLSTGRTLDWPDEVTGVPHDLADAIWFDNDHPPLERVELHFALYRAMPCYANLMYADLSQLDTESLDWFWRYVRELLNDSDGRLADPVAYWLWCGPFEDPAESTEAWNRTVTGQGVGDRGLERALAASGPVPWQTKASLLRKLLPTVSWHRAIFHSIQASVFDVFGDVDAAEAKRLLASLKLPGDAREAATRLRDELGARAG
jgi:hypothetical protein